MPAQQKLTYEAPFDRVNEPEDVLTLLNDVKNSITKINPSFEGDLRNIVNIIDTEVYVVNGDISTSLDLSKARGWIDFFRRRSEGGCQSCVSLGRQTIDAQDASSGVYCKVSDPDYDEEKGVKYGGFSPKVREHYKNPCEAHRPFFFQTLDQILA